MSRIFKLGSVEDELFQGMQEIQQEVVDKEATQEQDTVMEAMAALNAAASRFERCGSVIRAQEVTDIMTSIAEGKKSKKKKSSSKDEAKKVFKFFGFDLDDFDGEDCGDGDGE